MFQTDKRAQAIVMDFAFGFLLFVIAWIFISAKFDERLLDSQNSDEIDSMRIRADYIADSLVNSKGIPQNWEDVNILDVNAIGLAKSNRVLSEEKLSAFSNLSGSYDDVKSRMNAFGFDFYFEFDGVDDSNAGLEPFGDATKVTVKRIVTYKEEIGVATLTLYRLE